MDILLLVVVASVLVYCMGYFAGHASALIKVEAVLKRAREAQVRQYYPDKK